MALPEIQSGTFPFLKLMQQLRQEVGAVEAAWGALQSTRRRDAIYDYLTAVYRTVVGWRWTGRAEEYAKRALESYGLPRHGVIEPFGVVICCSIIGAELHSRTRNKWVCILQYAEQRQVKARDLASFMKRKGGINRCGEKAQRSVKCAGCAAKLRGAVGHR